MCRAVKVSIFFSLSKNCKSWFNKNWCSFNWMQIYQLCKSVEHKTKRFSSSFSILVPSSSSLKTRYIHNLLDLFLKMPSSCCAQRMLMCLKIAKTWFSTLLNSPPSSSFVEKKKGIYKSYGIFSYIAASILLAKNSITATK